MPFTRPTTDIAREGLFNILQNNLEIEELKTLDLFGGTGCISYELASRGAKDLTIIEKDNSMFDFIKKTAEILKFDHFKVLRSDVFKYIENFLNHTSQTHITMGYFLSRLRVIG